ncbi:MAG: hypothetical protein JNM34_07060 [Chthonomonadaceae bacterium]|nr:hypothetical protein [Chthonomonadaceae bacterium]
MAESEATTNGHPKKVKVLVKAYVLMHMFLITNWSLPKPAPAFANGTVKPTVANILRNLGDFILLWNDDIKFGTPLKYYVLSTGSWQYWDMFAPNPANVDYWWDAIVTYKSGKVVEGIYPRIKSLNYFQKYLKERYRKYLERVNTDGTDSWKRPTFAQRIALLAYRDKNDPPVRVQLRRHFRINQSMYDPAPPEYKEFILFDYVVDQDKLQRFSK